MFFSHSKLTSSILFMIQVTVKHYWLVTCDPSLTCPLWEGTGCSLLILETLLCSAASSSEAHALHPKCVTKQIPYYTGQVGQSHWHLCEWWVLFHHKYPEYSCPIWDSRTFLFMDAIGTTHIPILSWWKITSNLTLDILLLQDDFQCQVTAEKVKLSELLHNIK